MATKKAKAKKVRYTIRPCPPECGWCIPIRMPETTATLGLHETAEATEAPSPPLDAAATERLIDFCRRNLAAPAWLPLAVQRQLFAALTDARRENSGLRYRLTATACALRDSLRDERAAHQHTKNLFASITRRVADAEQKVAKSIEITEAIIFTKSDRERLKALGRSNKGACYTKKGRKL